MAERQNSINRSRLPGSANPNWRGGRTIASTGYVLIKVGKNHHLADVRGYAYEHRIVAEEKMGRRLLPNEQVHHIDHNKQNNTPPNLLVVQDIAHHRLIERKRGKALKHPDEPNPIVSCGCGCGNSFNKYDSSGRPRVYIPGHNPRRINPATGRMVAHG